MTGTAQTSADSRVLKRFTAMAGHQRLAHAYLFHGPSGSGKWTTAVNVARALNCDVNSSGTDHACGECPSCQKIASGNHPDVVLVDEGTDEKIRIERVRELISRGHLRPYEGRYKVVLIRHADMMTVEAANALLKTLEEPSGQSLMILLTSSPQRLLSTIRSRCHGIPFFALSRKDLVNRMITEHQLDPPDAAFLADYCEGSYGQAVLMAEDRGQQKRDQYLKAFFGRAMKDKDLKELLADRDATREALDMLLLWFRDVLLAKAGLPAARTAHAEKQRELKQAAAKYSLIQIREIIDDIVRTRKNVRENLNVKLPLMMLKEKL
ncbi:MAG: DNA polymerase III subunit delta' [Candidatus Omnitrophota bacterium]